MKTIGERILLLRQKNKLSQRMVMKKLSISNLGRIERNERTPGIEIIISLAKFFNVTTDWILLGGNEETHNGHSMLTDEDQTLLQNIKQLTPFERAKVEGIVQGILLAKTLQD